MCREYEYPGVCLPSGSPHGAIIHTGQQEPIVTVHKYPCNLFIMGALIGLFTSRTHVCLSLHDILLFHWSSDLLNAALRVTELIPQSETGRQTQIDSHTRAKIRIF